MPPPPPPSPFPLYLDAFGELLLLFPYFIWTKAPKIIVYELKFLRFLDVGHPPPFCLENVQSKAVKSPPKCLAFGLENVQTQAKKWLKNLVSGQ